MTRHRLSFDRGRVSTTRTRSPTLASFSAVVGVELAGALHGLAVAGVADPLGHGHDHGGLHLVGDDETLARLATATRLLGRSVSWLGHHSSSSSASVVAVGNLRRHRRRRASSTSTSSTSHLVGAGGLASGAEPGLARRLDLDVLDRTAPWPGGGRHRPGVAALCQRDLAVTQDREDPGHVLADDREAHDVVELAGGELEAEIEHLAAVLVQAALELLVVELAQF